MIYLKYTSCADDYKSRHRAALEVLDYILCRAFGIQNAVDVITKTDIGKPYIKDADFDFSVSHTASAVVAAVCGGGERINGLICIDESIEKIGVDIEFEDRPVSSRAIKLICQRFFSVSEQEYVKAGTNGDRIRFLEIWTRKESIVKATGKGISSMRVTDSFHNNVKYLNTIHIVIDSKKYIISIAGIQKYGQ